MRYPDPELAAAVPSLTPIDLSDPVAAREVNRQRLTGGPGYPARGRLLISAASVPGPAGPVPVRIYRPAQLAGPLPAVMWVHGGAFIVGDLDGCDALCAHACDRAAAVVVSVGYRLAPEHPCSAGLEDCSAVLQWLIEHAGDLGVDGDRIAVAGESAGGCLAAGAALRARDRGLALAFQLLIYPVLDDRCSSQSAREATGCPVFTAESNRLMWEIYLKGGEADGYIAPARMRDLRGLPPTYLLAAEHDPLRDEALEYARRLLAAGISVELKLAAGTFHGFDLTVPDAPVSRREQAAYMDALARALAVAPPAGRRDTR